MHVMSHVFRLAFLLRVVLPASVWPLLAITGIDEHSMPFASPPPPQLVERESPRSDQDTEQNVYLWIQKVVRTDEGFQAWWSMNGSSARGFGQGMEAVRTQIRNPF